MKLARRMMVCRIGRGSSPPPDDLLIDDCETAWTATTGLLRTVNATPTAGGSGYTAGDILDVTTGGAGGQVQVSTVDGGGAVTAIAHYAGGYGGYTTGTGKATTGGTGTGCTIEITVISTLAFALDSAVFHDGANAGRITSTNIPPRSLVAFLAVSPGDLSAYSRMKAWVRRASTGTPADHWRLCLCSDAVGRVVEDEFSAPAIPSASTWVEMNATRIGSGRLVSSYASVALYRGVPAWSTGTFHFDSIRVSA